MNVSNWGRWGEDDEFGTLNLIDDAAQQRAADAVQTGRSVSLAKVTVPSPVVSGPYHEPPARGSAVQQLMGYVPGAYEASLDTILVINHHPQSTHLDALCHQALEGRVYPGRPFEEAVGMTGPTHGSTTAFAAGVVTRGVLLDLAADGPLAVDHLVGPADLDAAAQRAGIEVQPGDALVVRGGWDIGTHPEVPGLGVEAVEWLHDNGISIYLGDIADARPIRLGQPNPLHKIAMVQLGMPLVDVADLTDLAKVCAELGRWEFMLTLAPPRIHGLTGVPVNPIAVF